MGRYTLYKYSTRLMAVLLCVLLLIPVIPTALADGESGTCGAGLSWTLSAGTLTITGSGAMENYTEQNMAPWYPIRDQILRLQLPEGLTSIGSLAFYECRELTAVTIPSTVTTIGSYAFAKCSDMGLLNLGSGVKNIGESAFSDCYTLAALNLPGGVQRLGAKAFYRCESIPTVHVPAGVTYIGMSAFGYCKKMVSADIQANITVIPEYLFFGCENLVNVTLPDSADSISSYAFRGCDQLTTVYYDGTAQTPEQIQQTIGSDVPSFGNTGFVTDAPSTGPVNAGTATENGDGTVTQENISVSTGSGSTVSTNVQVSRPQDATSGGEYKADITVTVDGDAGWDEAQTAVDKGLSNYNEAVTLGGGTNQGANVTVYVTNTEKVDPNFVNVIAGRDVNMTIITANGSSWNINGLDLVVGESADYNLTYQILAAPDEVCEELGVSTCFLLQFAAPAQVNARVDFNLGSSTALQVATLLQKDREFRQIQSVVVDQQGFASFYLASVSEKTEYYIAMSLPNPEHAPYVPDSLKPNFGVQENYRTIEYEITGRESSWGLQIGQVTWIMVGVILGTVVIVGAVLFVMNKRKLKRGYVPDLEEYEDP